MLLGNKIKLRAVLKADLEKLHNLYIQPGIIDVLSYKGDISLAHFEAKLDANMDVRGKRAEWLVIENDNGDVVGSIAYKSEWRPTAMILEDLYIGNEYQGKGYATDAVKRLVKYLFEEKEIRRLEVLVREDCTAALKVFEKASFYKEGERRKSAYANGTHLNEVVLSIISKEYFRE